MEEGLDVDSTAFDIDQIHYQEAHHFTLNRMLFMFINFGVLLLNNMIFKQEKYSKTQK